MTVEATTVLSDALPGEVLLECSTCASTRR